MPYRNDNFHSEQAQEIMGKAPSWVVRRGITVVFAILTSILAGCWFIKYPEIVEAPVEITTLNPSAELITRYDGLIDTICVENHSTVRKGDLIAVLSNPADYADMERVERHLLTSSRLPLRETVKQEWIDGEYDLGTIQSAFAAFQSQCVGYRHYIEVALIPNKRRNLQDELKNYEELYASLKAQQLILEKDLEYERRDKARDSMLYAGGVISRSDYNATLRSLLAKERERAGFEGTVSNTRLTITQNRHRLEELALQERGEIAEYERGLNSARQQLSAQIAQWREQYAIQSPSDGVVSLLRYWSRNQRIPAGERIATIIPEGEPHVIGRMSVPTAGFGKVKAGQRVNVKLSGYPYMEYGVLKGVITSLSAVPDQHPGSGTPAYIVEVEFPEGLVTSYGRELPLIRHMDGSGEIITQDMRLIHRFIRPIISLFRNR